METWPAGVPHAINPFVTNTIKRAVQHVENITMPLPKAIFKNYYYFLNLKSFFYELIDFNVRMRIWRSTILVFIFYHSKS